MTELLNFLVSHVSWVTAFGGLLSGIGAFGAAWSNLRKKEDAGSTSALVATRLTRISDPRKHPAVIPWLVVSLAGVLITVTSSLAGGALSAQKQQAIVDYDRGANSIAYLHLERLGTKDARATIRHCGPNPARDVAFDIVRQAEMDTGLSFQERQSRIVKARLGDIYAGQDIALDRFDFPDWSMPQRDRETYMVFIRSESGAYTQVIELLKHGDQWSHLYVLRNYIGEGDFARFSVYQAYIDPQFPVSQSDVPAVAAYIGRTLNSCGDRLSANEIDFDSLNRPKE